MKIVLICSGIALFLMIVLFIFACIKVAGRCSREEEKREEQIHKKF